MIGKLRNMTSIYLLDGDRILLLYREGSRVANNKWVSSAGGHFEENELNDAKACVIRELNEEISLNENDIENLKLKYITLRHTEGEIRQNYYFFAQIKSSNKKEITSNEGNLKWFNKDDIINLNMPFTAKYVLEHYFETGINNDIIYGAVANGKRLIFTELPEF